MKSMSKNIMLYCMLGKGHYVLGSRYSSLETNGTLVRAKQIWFHH